MLSAITLAFAGACSSAVHSPAPLGLAEQLTGSWRLVNYWNRATAGAQKTFPYGEIPCGYIVYTSTGQVTVQIARAPVDRNLPADSLIDGRVKDPVSAMGMVKRYVSYFGTFSVDSARGIVTHHVFADSRRVYAGKDEQRPFRVRGDTLVIGDDSTWNRTLIRETRRGEPNRACALSPS